MATKKETTKKTEEQQVEVSTDKDIITDDKTAQKENPNLRWYIVKGTSGREKSIGELIKQRISANDFDSKVTNVIVPTQEKVVIKKGKKDTVEERIFPGYILVQMEVSDEIVHIIRNTDGVQGFIGWSAARKRPTPLKDEEVTAIVEFTKVQQQPTFESKFVIGDAVKVADGPFKDFVGTVREINEAKGQVSVLLSIFGRETPVQLDFLQVNKI